MPAVLHRPIRLTIEEYRISHQVAGLSTMHWNLTPPGTPERRAGESAAIRDRALAGLRRLGLLEGREIHPDLADALEIVLRSDTQISARIAGTREGPPTGLVAATSGGYAVLAALTPNGFDLEPVRPDDLVDRTARRITPAGRAPGRPVTFPADLLAPGTPLTSTQLDHRLGGGGVPRKDVEVVRTMCNGAVRSAATIEVARDAGRRTAGVSLTHVETADGGVAFHYHREKRRLFCTITPCNASDLARLTTRLLEGVPG